MSADPTAHTRDFAAVLAAERDWIAQRRDAAGLPPPSDDVAGLAFSGGGIRSATFNLGVLQALEQCGLLREVDYLSSVSGGGYVASSYSWLRATGAPPPQPAFQQPTQSGSSALDWLRAHGKFLVAHRGYSLYTLAGALLAATLLNLLVLAPPLLLVVETATLGWLPLPWPSQLERYVVLTAHQGYWLLLVASLTCFALFVPLTLWFGLFAGRLVPQGDDRLDRLRVTMGRLLIAGGTLLAIGSIPVVVGLLEHLVTRVDRDAGGFGVHVTWLSTLASGALALWRGASGDSVNRQRLAMVGMALIVYALLVVAYAVAEHTDLLGSPLFFGLLALSVLLGSICDLNAVSMHGYYRDRISQTFMPALHPHTDSRAFKMDAITPSRGAPLHLVNTTLNTSTAHDVLTRARRGAGFAFSPLYCGSTPTGWLPAAHWPDSATRLATACTISGAAVDPDTRFTSNRALSVLMALFNLRLGYWTRNPAPDARRRLPLPRWWVLIAREMLAINLDGRQRDIHLSDGGGFENLGLYELVRRGVRRIVVVDAGCDPDLALADLGDAIERVRIDFGAHVAIDVHGFDAQRKDPLTGHPALCGTIRYADGTTGDLLYIKPLLSGGLGADLYAYWRAHPSFPNEPTSDQFFDEPQFEAYRRLGTTLVERLMGDAPHANLREWIAHVAAVTRKA